MLRSVHLSGLLADDEVILAEASVSVMMDTRGIQFM
jgi:hypothetical protein